MPNQVEDKMSHHLLGSHDDSLDAELATAHVEEVLERGTEEIDDEYVVETFVAEVIDLRNTS